MKSSKKIGFAVLGLAMAFSAACGTTESSRTEPVKTTTSQGSTTAPPATESEKRDKAQVRFVHAIPGAAAVDGFAGDTKIFNDIAFRTVTPYKEVSDIHQTFKIRAMGKDTSDPLATNAEFIGGGDHYTVIAVPDANGKPELRVLADKLRNPTPDKAQVRFFQAAPDAGEIDVFTKGQKDKLTGGLNFLSETPWKEVAPGTTTFEIHPEGKANTILSVGGMNLMAGKFYTVVVTGKAKGMPKLEAIRIEDQLVGASAEMK